MKGQVIIVTGANAGIGYETVKHLYKLNATIVLACRDKQRAENAIKELEKEIKSEGKLIFERLDLSDLESIEEFSENFKNKFKNLNILINNAGMIKPF